MNSMEEISLTNSFNEFSIKRSLQKCKVEKNDFHWNYSNLDCCQC